MAKLHTGGAGPETGDAYPPFLHGFMEPLRNPPAAVESLYAAFVVGVVR